MVWSASLDRNPPADGEATLLDAIGSGVLHFTQAIALDGLVNPH
jgi:hypothetical protein